jgi:hypothetical protein
MQDEQKKILLYNLTDEQETILSESYGAKYEIVKTECFTDILAIPAKMVVVNPETLNESDISQMNEVFQYDSETLIVFTKDLNEEQRRYINVNSFKRMRYYRRNGKDFKI